MNNLKVTLMMAGLVVLFMALGYRFGGQSGMVLAFLLAAGMNFFAYWSSDKMVLRMYRAQPVVESDHPRLFRVVKRVAARAMLPMPKVYIVPSRAPNAFATGRNPEHAAVAVSQGLLELLDEDELEGVIGHEISHVLHRDMLIGMVVATFAGAIGIFASMVRWGAILGGFGPRDSRNNGGLIGLLVAGILAPLLAAIIRSAISRQREFKADAEGGRLTGKYLPLASALEKLHRAPIRFNLDRHPATAHLMIANPLSMRGMSALFSTHPPYEERVARLRKLAQQPYA